MKNLFGKKIHWRKEFIKGWHKGWNILYKMSPIFLIGAIISLIGAGISTWYGLTYMNLSERNLLLMPLFNQFGVESVFIFDFFAILTFIFSYKLTRIISEKTHQKGKYIHVIIILSIYFATTMNFLNDFGLIIRYPPFYNFFQKAPMNNAFKILGIKV